jgi:hypothetical protein
MMKIELFHIDNCPSWQNGLKNLETALRAEGLEESIELVNVTDNTSANQLKFLGSPSFHIDGQDVWPEERDGYSLSCRIYYTPQGLKGFPTVAMLRKVLRKFKS